MKTNVSVQNEIKRLENELKLKSALGRAYLTDEAREMKLRLQELRMNEMKSQGNSI